MSASQIFVIGGTGAQGIPVVRALVADGRYSVRALTRDPTSRRAKELLELGARSAGQDGLWERVQPQNRTPILKIGEDRRTGRL